MTNDNNSNILSILSKLNRNVLEYDNLSSMLNPEDDVATISGLLELFKILDITNNSITTGVLPEELSESDIFKRIAHSNYDKTYVENLNLLHSQEVLDKFQSDLSFLSSTRGTENDLDVPSDTTFPHKNVTQEIEDGKNDSNLDNEDVEHHLDTSSINLEPPTQNFSEKDTSEIEDPETPFDDEETEEDIEEESQEPSDDEDKEFDEEFEEEPTEEPFDTEFDDEEFDEEFDEEPTEEPFDTEFDDEEFDDEEFEEDGDILEEEPEESQEENQEEYDPFDEDEFDDEEDDNILEEESEPENVYQQDDEPFDPFDEEDFDEDEEDEYIEESEEDNIVLEEEPQDPFDDDEEFEDEEFDDEDEEFDDETDPKTDEDPESDESFDPFDEEFDDEDEEFDAEEEVDQEVDQEVNQEVNQETHQQPKQSQSTPQGSKPFKVDSTTVKPKVKKSLKRRPSTLPSWGTQDGVAQIYNPNAQTEIKKSQEEKPKVKPADSMDFVTQKLAKRFSKINIKRK